MMEFEIWNRETLIKEIKRVMPIAFSKAIGNCMGLPTKPRLYTDKELHQETDYCLRKLYVDLKQYDNNFRNEYEKNEERKRFFNQPSADSDVDYWSKQAYWTIDEAIALLLGKDPRNVTWENVKAHLTKSPFAKKFNEIREQAQRYLHCKELFDPVFPGVFLAWSKRMDLDIPDTLMKAVTTMGVQVADWKGAYEQTTKQLEEANSLYDKAMELKNKIIEAQKLRIIQLENNQTVSPTNTHPVKETERQSLYKLLATMAYDGYGYDPTQKKSPLPAELSNTATLKLGENIDPDTVRKWLKAATSLYPTQVTTETE